MHAVVGTMSATEQQEYMWARMLTRLVRQHAKEIARLDVELAEMRDALVNMSDHLDKLRREQLKSVS